MSPALIFGGRSCIAASDRIDRVNLSPDIFRCLSFVMISKMLTFYVMGIRVSCRMIRETVSKFDVRSVSYTEMIEVKLIPIKS